MTKFNLFCYSDEYGDKDSFQQKSYRVFNTQITENEYIKIKIPKIKLFFDKDEEVASRYQTAFKKAWELLTKEKKQKFFDIPHFNWDIFTKITGVTEEK